jgi:hypothetical protein
MITWIRPCAAGRQSSSSTNLLVEDQLLGSQQGMGGIGGVGARYGVVSAEMMSYEEGGPGGFDPHKRIPDVDLDSIAGATEHQLMALFGWTRRRPLSIQKGEPRQARSGSGAAAREYDTATKASHFFRRLRPVGQAGRKNFDNQLCFSVVASPRGFEPLLPP